VRLLRQSTASQEQVIGPFVDDTDFKTPETALTIANTDIKIVKGGATTQVDKNSGGGTHIANGYYSIVFDATDTNTLGSLFVSINETGALPVWHEFEVISAEAYDALQSTGNGLRADIRATKGTALVGQAGYTGIDWSAVVNPSATVGLTNTTISTSQAVNSVTSAVTANVTQWGGTAVASATVRADLINIAGAAVSTTTAQLGVNAVQAGGTAWGSGAITAASIADGAIDRATFAADTGLQTVRSNTAQAGAATSITLDAGASSTTDFFDGCTILLTGGTGSGQYRLVTAYNGTTKVATVTPAWATNPDNTSTFAILPRGIADLAAILNVAVSTSTAQLGVNAVQAGGTAWGSGAITAASIATGAITSAKFAASAIDATAIATGAITSAKFAAGAIDAAAIAADAIGASELAADAATEIATAVADLFTGPSDTVQASPTPTTTSFAGSSSLSATDDIYNGCTFLPTSGTLDGIPRKITDYVGSTRTFTVSPAYTSAPASGVTFRIVGRID
jgi:hypothetical protein